MKPIALILAAVIAGVAADGFGGSNHRHGRQGRTSRRQGRRGQLGRRGRTGDAAAAPLGGYGAGDGALSQYSAGDEALSSYAADDAAGAGDDNLAMLEKAVPGIPGEDYPIYSEVPESGFSCEGQVDGGYYADPEAECQVFHICTADGQGGLAKYSFLCPNGTIFNQNYFICDWWFNFDCAEAEGLYSLNDDIAAEREAAAGGDAAAAPASYGAGPAPAPAPASYSGASDDYSGSDYSDSGSDYDYGSSSYDDALASYEAEAPATGYGAAEEAEAPLNNYEAERGGRAFRGRGQNSRRQGRRNNGRNNGRRAQRQGRRGFRG